MKKLLLLGAISGLFLTAGINAHAENAIPQAAEPVTEFSQIQTMASLKLSHNNEYATDIDLRFGGVIPASIYDDAAEYGVIAFSDNKELMNGTLAADKVVPANQKYSNGKIFNDINTEALLNEYKASGNAISFVNDHKPMLNENGDYQYSWVINNMENHYHLIMSATLYKLKDGKLELAKYKATTVNKMLIDYQTNNSVSNELKPILLNSTNVNSYDANAHYEAEGCKLYKAKVQHVEKDKTATAVGYTGAGSKLTLKINSDVARTVTLGSKMNIRVRANIKPTEDPEVNKRLAINVNNNPLDLSAKKFTNKPHTGGDVYWRRAYFDFEFGTIDLKAGLNVIVFECLSNGADFDYFTLTEVVA